jgi:hypothetical protein
MKNLTLITILILTFISGDTYSQSYFGKSGYTLSHNNISLSMDEHPIEVLPDLYVLSYFNSKRISGGYLDWDDTVNVEYLRIAISDDGKNWTDLGGVYNPNWNFRDPSILQVNDTFFVAYTRQAWVTGTNFFSIIKSIDLNNWYEVADIHLSGLGIQRTFAPEWYIEDGKYYIIVSASLTSNASDMQTYLLEANNINFNSFKLPVKITVTGKTNIIDSDIIKEHDLYYMYYKLNESPYQIELATSTTLTGQYTPIKIGSWSGGWSGEIEGQNIHKTNYGYLLYLDVRTPYGAAQGFGYSESIKLDGNWSTIIDFNINADHGSVIKVNRKKSNVFLGAN